MGLFWRRARQKAREHLQRDPTGLSLLKYSVKWCWFRGKRRLIRLISPAAPRRIVMPENRAVAAVRVTGGIGDYIVIARVLRDLAAASPNLRFHVYASTVSSGRYVFGWMPAVDAIYDAVFFDDMRDRYDCSLFMSTFAWYDHENFRIRKVGRLAPRFAACMAALRASRRTWEPFIAVHPTLDGAAAHMIVARGHSRRTFLHHQFGLPAGPLELDLPCDFDVADRLAARYGRFITFNNGFDAHFVVATSTATKCYPAEHWNRVVALIKEACPDVGIVQIGARTSTVTSGADENLIGRTTLAQAAAILKRATLHLDNEGGLVHMAASLGTPCVVLFGPTSLDYFAYPRNANVKSPVCGNCWWATERWMECCPRGYESVRCLEQLDPAVVAQAAIDRIRLTVDKPAPAAAT